MRRLTADEGVQSNPAFSPDGSLIAFTAQYDGNLDVYVVPVSGGVPTRLTWHPGPDIVQDFTPDGSAVMFTSPRAVFTGRYTQLFTVPVRVESKVHLSCPTLRARHILPTDPSWLTTRSTKHSTSGNIIAAVQTQPSGFLASNDNSSEKIPQPETRANDAGPMWVGDTIYFRSDRNGEFNLFSYNPKSKAIKQLTEHKDFPVLAASASDDGNHL